MLKKLFDKQNKVTCGILVFGCLVGATLCGLAYGDTTIREWVSIVLMVLYGLYIVFLIPVILLNPKSFGGIMTQVGNIFISIAAILSCIVVYTNDTKVFEPTTMLLGLIIFNGLCALFFGVQLVLRFMDKSDLLPAYVSDAATSATDASKIAALNQFEEIIIAVCEPE